MTDTFLNYVVFLASCSWSRRSVKFLFNFFFYWIWSMTWDKLALKSIVAWGSIEYICNLTLNLTTGVAKRTHFIGKGYSQSFCQKTTEKGLPDRTKELRINTHKRTPFITQLSTSNHKFKSENYFLLKSSCLNIFKPRKM